MIDLRVSAVFFLVAACSTPPDYVRGGDSRSPLRGMWRSTLLDCAGKADAHKASDASETYRFGRCSVMLDGGYVARTQGECDVVATRCR